MTRVLLYEPYVFTTYGNMRYIEQLLDGIDPSRYRVILAAPADSEPVRKLRERGVEVVVVPTPGPLRSYGGRLLRLPVLGRLLVAIGIVWHSIRLVGVLRRQAIDIVQCHSIRAVLTIGLAAKISRVPVIWYIKGDLENPLLDRIGFVLSDKVLYLTETNKALFYPRVVARHEKKIAVIPIGIDLDEVRRIRGVPSPALAGGLSIPGDTVNIGYFGRISAPKGVTFLVEAIDTLIGKGARVRLYIVGDEGTPQNRAYGEDVRRAVEARGLSEHVVFTGWRGDALAIMSRMDIVALPSLTEGLPTCILEAMACAKPVVTTDVGGVREIVEEGRTGYVVPTERSDALATRLWQLIDDPGARLRFGQRAESLVRERFSMEHNVAGMQRIYDELQATTAAPS